MLKHFLLLILWYCPRLFLLQYNTKGLFKTTNKCIKAYLKKRIKAGKRCLNRGEVGNLTLLTNRLKLFLQHKIAVIPINSINRDVRIFYSSIQYVTFALIQKKSSSLFNQTE